MLFKKLILKFLILFSDPIWVILHVDSGGTLALMQQMNKMTELGAMPQDFGEENPSINPFAPTLTLDKFKSDHENVMPFNVSNSSEASYNVPCPTGNPSGGSISNIRNSEPDNDGDVAMS